MPPTGFEPTVPAKERPQALSLDSAATGIGQGYSKSTKNQLRHFFFKNYSNSLINICIRQE
jgi:hypothetical protein